MAVINAMAVIHGGIRAYIDTCPKLSFINPAWRIWLRTDASNFGIGAYLFQINDAGEEIPIEFLSKSLTLGQEETF